MGSEMSFKEQIILILLLGIFIITAIICGIGYAIAEGELAGSFSKYGSIAGITAILIAMLGHTTLRLFQRLFGFKL
ncbi:hypothetical protein [Teredinibacter purpureus]|uniref:hypothetical protein n=1 Tax=Teredinibacter purpureus TaxID=2731756 RepID=UPI0005F79A56|nr:hypothetical protein [Teredinibacter purpureus]